MVCGAGQCWEVLVVGSAAVADVCGLLVFYSSFLTIISGVSVWLIVLHCQMHVLQQMLWNGIITLRAGETAAQRIVIGPVCWFVCVGVFVGLLPR